MFGFNPRLVGVLMLDSDTATVRREVRPGGIAGGCRVYLLAAWQPGSLAA
jgi:hypothetical protein